VYFVVCVILQITQMKKKKRKSSDFWKEVAQAVGHHSGEEVERLMKTYR